LDILRRQSSTERIPRLLTPLERTRLGHSIGHAAVGDEYLCINDAGFYTDPALGINLVLVFFTGEVKSFPAVNEFIGQLSRWAVDMCLSTVKEGR